MFACLWFGTCCSHYITTSGFWCTVFISTVHCIQILDTFYLKGLRVLSKLAIWQKYIDYIIYQSSAAKWTDQPDPYSTRILILRANSTQFGTLRSGSNRVYLVVSTLLDWTQISNLFEVNPTLLNPVFLPWGSTRPVWTLGPKLGWTWKIRLGLAALYQRRC